MDYKKILFGYDGSPESMAAFNRTVEIAKSNHAKLIIASVMKKQHANTASVSLGFGVIETGIDLQDTLDQWKTTLEKLKQDAQQQGLPAEDIEVVFKQGSPKSMLSYTLPKEYDVDLIVLGATGMGTVAQVILGSTASYVVENAAPDVVIVKNN